MSGIVVAPFSNSEIRDWPLDNYSGLIGLLLERGASAGPIRVVGTRNQVLRACEIVRKFDPVRVLNDCGRLTWPQVLTELKTADCVIGNNSGIAHLSSYYGAPTVCVFGGSHQRLEWRPLGFNVMVVSRSIGCSPCHLDHGQTSPFAKACLRDISPEVVMEAVFRVMARARAMRAGEVDPRSTSHSQRLRLAMYGSVQ